MKKQLLSLILTLTLCAAAVPAFAAGDTVTPKTPNEGLTVSVTNVLRTETAKYKIIRRDRSVGILPLTLYVVGDEGAVISAAAKPGYTYDVYFEIDGQLEEACRFSSFGDTYHWDPAAGCFVEAEYDTDWSGEMHGPESCEITLSQTSDFYVNMFFGVTALCESDFARLVPTEVKPNAAEWAQDTLDRAVFTGLFPDSFDPFAESCARGMTRYEFAAVAVKLYQAMGGSLENVGYDAPFTDVQYDYYVDLAYNLGFVSGISDTIFAPDAPLTREQAAAILARVYARLYGAIPAAGATGFADDSAISGWAKSSVAFLSDKGFVSGVGDNQFAPQKQLSIQEAVCIAQRMLEKLR